MGDIKNKKLILLWIVAIVYLIVGIYHVVSVTSLYELMGDDRNNLLTWYNMMRSTGFLERTWNDVKDNITRIIALKSRYYPLFLKSHYLLGVLAKSIVAYRTYIAVNVFLVIIVMAFLFFRLEPNNNLWFLFVILAPFSLNIYGYNDGNTLISYHSIVPSVFLIVLYALHCQLSFIRSGKKIWGILTGLFTLMACLSYETAYLIVFPSIVLCIYDNSRNIEGEKNGLNIVKKRLGGSLPVVVVVAFCFFLYVLAIHKTDYINGDTAVDKSIGETLYAFILHLVPATPLGSPLLGIQIVGGGDIIVQDFLYPILGGLVLFIFIIRNKSILNIKGYEKGLLLGLSIAIPPAFIIAMTYHQKYGHSGWAYWGSGWITAIQTTFGYMIIVAYLVMAISHYSTAINSGMIHRIILAGVISAILVLCGTYTHAASRIHGGDRAYAFELMRHSLWDGGMSGYTEDSVFITEFDVNTKPDETYFFESYSGKDIGAVYKMGGDIEYSTKDGLYIYSPKTSSVDGYKDIHYILIGEYNRDDSWQIDNAKIYVDTSRITENMKLVYFIAENGSYTTRELDAGDIIDKIGNGSRGFIDLDGENILPESINFVLK